MKKRYVVMSTSDLFRPLVAEPPLHLRQLTTPGRDHPTWISTGALEDCLERGLIPLVATSQPTSNIEAGQPYGYKHLAEHFSCSKRTIARRLGSR